jgi:hypothetical protein
MRPRFLRADPHETRRNLYQLLGIVGQIPRGSKSFR